MMRRHSIVAGLTALGLLLGSGAIGTATAAKKDPVILETVAENQINSFFDITTLYHQSVAQSMRVRSTQTWKSITLSISEIKVAKSKKVFRWMIDGGYDENWFTSYRSYRENEEYATKGRVIVEVWRYDRKGRVPDLFDLDEDFTRVHRSSLKRTFRVGGNLVLPLKKGVAVTKGDYVIVFGLRFNDPLMFNLRFDGQENGTNTMGGYDHDVPIDCTYTPSKDANPGGQAYRPIPEGRIDPDNLVRPFFSRYEVVDTKVATSCDMTGIYGDENQIWNPGDLRLVFRGKNR